MCYLLGSWTSSVQELYFIFFPPCSFVSEELVSLLRSSLPVPRDGWRYVWLARILSTCKTGEQAFFPTPSAPPSCSLACLFGRKPMQNTYLLTVPRHSLFLSQSFFWLFDLYRLLKDSVQVTRREIHQHRCALNEMMQSVFMAYGIYILYFEISEHIWGWIGMEWKGELVLHDKIWCIYHEDHCVLIIYNSFHFRDFQLDFELFWKVRKWADGGRRAIKNIDGQAEERVKKRRRRGKTRHV